MRRRTSLASPSFGSGGDTPYDTAVHNGGGVLRLVDSAEGYEQHIELGRFLTAADAADLSVLSRAQGAILDIGCGPGRMVRAALLDGDVCLGIDVSPAAVDHATAQGLPVLRRSVWDPIPREGEWGSALLLDGNIGIGDDPTALLARCAELVGDDGSVFVEAHPDPWREVHLEATLVDGDGGTSDAFPWCEVGAAALAPSVAAAGLQILETWQHDERSFLHLRRAAADAPIPAEFSRDVPA